MASPTRGPLGAAERVSSVGLAHGQAQPRVATFTTDGGRFECVDFRAAPRASARLAFQARAAEPALYAHASGLARGDGAALGFGSGRVALYDVRRLPLPVATVRAGVANKSEEVKLLGELTANWMEMQIVEKKMPLTPHQLLRPAARSAHLSALA